MIIEIVDTFRITGRGTVAAVRVATTFPLGHALRATVVRPDGSRLETRAYREFLCRRDPGQQEQEAFLLPDVALSEVPPGSRLEILPPE